MSNKISLSQKANAGAWAWAKYRDEVIDKALKAVDSQAVGHTTEKIKHRWSQVNWESVSSKYQQSIQKNYGTTRVLGKPDPISLEGIFTDLHILDKPTAYRRYDIEKLRQEPEQIKPSSAERINGLRLVNSHRGQRLFILGKPGAGKTTFLKYISLQATKGHLKKVPIFVGLKEWADSGLELMSFLFKQFDICDFPSAKPFVEHMLEKGNAVVLFDALDEVPQAQDQRDKTIAEIRDFTNKYDASQCLITCRIAATDYTFEHFDYVEIADFNDEQISDYARKWFQDDDQKYKFFVEGIKKPENKGLYELASVPILLTLLCLSFNASMEFPQRRVEVYEDAIQALLKLWDSSRNIKRDEIYHGLTYTRKRQLLSYVATITFQQDKYFVPQSELSSLIVKFLRQLPDTEVNADIDGDNVLNSIEEQHGILSKRAPHIYSFSHLTFQEYFVAREVVDYSSGDSLKALVSKETVAEDRWREVILMTASLLSNAKLFFERFWDAIYGLISTRSNLLEMFDWANRKAQQSGVGEDTVIGRLYYLTLGLIFDNDKSLDRQRARSLQVALVRAEQFAQMLESEVDLFKNQLTRFPLGLNKRIADNEAFEPDRAYDLPYEFQLMSEVAADTHPSVDLVLTRLLFVTDLLTNSMAEGPRRVLTPQFVSYYRHTLEQYQLAFGNEVESALAEITSTQGLVRQSLWVRFDQELRNTLRQQRDIGHEWRLTRHDIELLQQALQANKLVYDCLKVAAVEERKTLSQYLLSLEYA